MKELICILCPNSCKLTVEGEKIKGNKCQRGINFAQTELTNPKRTLTTTVQTDFADMPVLSVRTDGEIEKSKITLLMTLLKNVKVCEKVKMGEVIVSDVLGSGVNIIATKNID